MLIAYIAVTVLAAGANLFSAGADFVRYEQVTRLTWPGRASLNRG
jgi:hypothetical protein